MFHSDLHLEWCLHGSSIIFTEKSIIDFNVTLMSFLFIFTIVKKKQHCNTIFMVLCQYEKQYIELSATCFHQLEGENFDSSVKDCCKHLKHVKQEKASSWNFQIQGWKKTCRHYSQNQKLLLQFKIKMLVFKLI